MTRGFTLVEVIIAMAIVGVILSVFITPKATKERKSQYTRLMKECRDDGKKEYECIGILDKIGVRQ